MRNEIKFYIFRGLAIFLGIVTLILVVVHYEIIHYNPETGKTTDIWGFSTSKFDYDNPYWAGIFDAFPQLANMFTLHNIVGLLGAIVCLNIILKLWELSKKYK